MGLMDVPYERRRHKRYDMIGRGGKLILIRETEGRGRRESCTLVNLSYGGMRFLAPHPLLEGMEHEFQMDLRWPLEGSASVRALIRRVHAAEGGGWDVV